MIVSNSGSPLFLCEVQTHCLPDWLDRVCKAVYHLAMKILNSICNCFKSPRDSTPVPLTTNTNPLRAAGPLNLIAFYREQEANNNGVTLQQILAWDDTRLESVHNYIQWLFPLKTVSGPNPTAPILDNSTIQTFQSNPALKNQVLRSFRRMLTFYGLQMDEGSKLISRAANFNARASVWLHQPSGHHNFLRITRILESMKLLGLNDHCTPFFNVLLDIAHHEGKDAIHATTLGYWRAALA